MSVKVYAVKIGVHPGVYYTWEECKSQVDKVPGASYRSFSTKSEAEEWLSHGTIKRAAKTASDAKKNKIFYILINGDGKPCYVNRMTATAPRNPGERLMAFRNKAVASMEFQKLKRKWMNTFQQNKSNKRQPYQKRIRKNSTKSTPWFYSEREEESIKNALRIARVGTKRLNMGLRKLG